jgi:hypothetical protein
MSVIRHRKWRECQSGDENERYRERESAIWVRSGLNQTVSDIETKTWTQIQSRKFFHCALQCHGMLITTVLIQTRHDRH